MIGAIELEIKPKAKQSVVQGVNSKTGKKVFFTPTKKKKYQQDLKVLFMAKIKGPYPKIKKDVPVSLRIFTYLPIPSRLKGKIAEDTPVITKPDVDNMVKPINDALEGLLFEQDQQVCELTVKKLYSSRPRIYVRWETVQL